MNSVAQNSDKLYSIKFTMMETDLQLPFNVFYRWRWKDSTQLEPYMAHYCWWLYHAELLKMDALLWWRVRRR